MSANDVDRGFMAQAIALATGRMGETWPNPAVGCVIVKDGRVVAQAATAPGGRPHAEEQAVPAAGADAAGSTVYVTLEPCGARSSGRKSCAHFLTEAGVARVVVACLDPSPFAAGRGTERLRAQGLTVETGLMSEEAAVLWAAVCQAGVEAEDSAALVAWQEQSEGWEQAVFVARELHWAEACRLNELAHEQLA